MTAFAYYRLPCEQHATYVAQHVGEPEILSSVAQLNGKEGFVIAPFQPSAECPVVLIHPDEVRDFVPEAQCVDDAKGGRRVQKSPCTEAYARDYECFHGQLERGVFRKIVLARKSTLHTRLSAEALFQKACRLYPRLFVALVYTEPSGMWLMATPEILLQGNGNAFQTMSLAGTQKAPATTIPPLSTKAVEALECAAEGPGGAAVRHRLYRGVHQDLLRRLSSAGSLHDDGGPSVSSAYRHPFPSALCRRAGRCARSALSHASRVWHSQGASPQVYPAS